MMDLYAEEDLSDECMLSKTKDIGSQDEFGKGRNPGMSNTVSNLCAKVQKGEASF